MSDFAPSRRALLASALAAGAYPLLPGLARASAASGPPQPFSFDILKEQASALAQEAYVPMAVPDGSVLDRIDYDAHNAIRFRENAALFADAGGRSPVQFFFPGRYFKQPVHVYTLADGMASEVGFDTGFFEIPADSPAQELTATEGFAGFSVQDPDTRRDWMAFLGASYWRTEGHEGQFGLSVRGLAMDTAMPDTPEEFPRFTRFWLEPGEGGAMTVYALLESPRATGAYRIASTRPPGGGPIVQDVEAQIFLRGDVGRLGVAPLTSMYWFGKPDGHVAPDWRPEVHDSDGLEILTAEGERIWRPLNNPPRTMANSFQAAGLRGFGLMQRERDFDRYQDDGVFYEKRASAWITPQDDWGDGAVTLIEIPTNDEIHDNIVAFWTPSEAAVSGGSFDMRYRLTWDADCPEPEPLGRFTAMRIGAGGVPGQPRPDGVVKVVLDVEGPGLEGLEREEAIRPVISTSVGQVDNLAAYPVVGASMWRAMFDLDFSELSEGEDPAIDLRLYVDRAGAPLTETCLCQLFPSQLRRLLSERA